MGGLPRWGGICGEEPACPQPRGPSVATWADWRGAASWGQTWIPLSLQSEPGGRPGEASGARGRPHHARGPGTWGSELTRTGLSPPTCLWCPALGSVEDPHVCVVCVCLYVCVSVCVLLCVSLCVCCVCICVCVYLCVSLGVYCISLVYMLLRMSLCICTQVCVSGYILYVYLCVFVCISASVSLCVSVRVSLCVSGHAACVSLGVRMHICVSVSLCACCVPRRSSLRPDDTSISLAPRVIILMTQSSHPRSPSFSSVETQAFYYFLSLLWTYIQNAMRKSVCQ